MDQASGRSKADMVRGARAIAVMVLLMLCAAATAFSQQADAMATAQKRYDALAKHVRGGDLEIDWKALRVSAEMAGLSQQYNLEEASDRFREQYENHDCEAALKIAHEIEDHDIADGFGHYFAVLCLVQLRRMPEAGNERAIVDALGDSIRESGNGSSANSAWFVVSDREELFFTEDILRIRLETHQTVRRKDHIYDVGAFKDAAGFTRTLWFNIDTDIK
jgi:hypothetical protein